MAAVLSLLGGGPPVQDYIVLSGVPSPGLATIKGAGTPRDWDIRKGWGFSGATVVYTGDNVAKFSVQIYLWDKAQFAEWAVFARANFSKPPFGTRPKALPIDHPILNAPPLKITSVVVEDVTQFEQDEYGGWTCEIKFIEFRQALPALGKPDGTIPAVPSPVPTARDANEQMIEQLRAQRDALAAGG